MPKRATAKQSDFFLDLPTNEGVLSQGPIATHSYKSGLSIHTQDDEPLLTIVRGETLLPHWHPFNGDVDSGKNQKNVGDSDRLTCRSSTQIQIHHSSAVDATPTPSLLSTPRCLREQFSSLMPPSNSMSLHLPHPLSISFRFHAPSPLAEAGLRPAPLPPPKPPPPNGLLRWAPAPRVKSQQNNKAGRCHAFPAVFGGLPKKRNQ